jgi:hypothetical protein
METKSHTSELPRKRFGLHHGLALLWAVAPAATYFITFDVVSLPGQNWTLGFLVLHGLAAWLVAGLVLFFVALTCDGVAGLVRLVATWIGAVALAVVLAVGALILPIEWTLPMPVRIAWWRDGAAVVAAGVSPHHIECADSLDLSSYFVCWRRVAADTFEVEWDGDTYRAGAGVEWHADPRRPGRVHIATLRVSDEWCYLLEDH